MSYSPLVSIIIPVYNGSNFLRQAIDSALGQTYKNIEIIVVNDGSNDNGACENIALSYGDRIRYIYKENGGVSSALNLAIENSDGEWISWLSHDDLYYPQKIEKEVLFLNRILNDDPCIDKDKVVIHCATESIDKDGRVLKRPSYNGVSEKEESLNVIIDNVYRYRLSGCSFLLPKAAFCDIGGFREDIRTVSDVEYWYRLLFNNYQFFCLKNEILVKNRSHGRQVGKTKVDLFEKELNELHIHISDMLYANTDWGTVRNMETLYLGLVKRRILGAAKYTKEKYLAGNMSKIRYFFGLKIKELYYSVIGKTRDILRIIYRKILVK